MFFLSLLGAGQVRGASGSSAEWGWADWRLIDESVEPATGWTGDWQERVEGDRRWDFPVVVGEKSGKGGKGGKGGKMAERRPDGALSGKIVFMNGGHGWTFDPSYWRLQRPVLNGMVEDYGNLDQVNRFAEYCFNAGAVVVPMRPLGWQANEVVMDNDDAGVVFAGTWFDSTASTFFGSAGDVPYRYAALDESETATATYVPLIPEAGFYPVYTWVRTGSDRGDQLYRVRHTGGETELRIPHHKVGMGWVYLGEYYFAAGRHAATGAVVVSNLRGSAAGSWTFADAVRFGNGMGSVDRGSGVSGYPREDESCRYWIQANLGQGQSSTLYDGGGGDESDSWSAPAKMSAEMNRELAGGVEDRVHVSFHSNAAGGSARGTVALTTSDPTPNQAELALLLGTEVTGDLVSMRSPPLEYPWNERASKTYAGGYSEIDGSLFNYEMAATIVEVAFHDNVEDARLMRDARVRSAVGRAAMHGIVRYFRAHDRAVPLAFLPEPPRAVRAERAGGGVVRVSWQAPVREAGSGAATGYVVRRSRDGKGFGAPVEVGDVREVEIGGLDGTWYFRVAARNTGGESVGSKVAGCGLDGEARVLVVDAFDRAGRSLNPKQDVGRQAWDPPGLTGAVDRVIPRVVNAGDYVVAYGAAMAGNGAGFDSCPSAAVAGGDVLLGDYEMVVWACGQESTEDESFNPTEQALVRGFCEGGGTLFVSGSEVAWDLDRASGPSAADRAFFREVLRAEYGSDHAGTWEMRGGGGPVFGEVERVGFDDGTAGVYPVRTPDVVRPVGVGVSVAMAYFGGGGDGLGAALAYDGSGGGGRVIYLGVPFEALGDAALRARMMGDVLGFLLWEDPLGDEDGDGMVALLERVLGRSPEVWEAGPGIEVVRDAGGVVMRFPRSQLVTGVRIAVEMAESLDGGWVEVAEAVDWQAMVALEAGVEIEEQVGDVLGWVEVRLVGGWRFGRLKVEER